MARIYSNPNPEKLVDAYLARVKGDPEARAGLRNGMIDELLRRTKLSGSGMKNILADPKYNRVFTKVLTEDEKRRLDEIIDLSERIERGDRKTLERIFSRGVSTLGGLLGAALGRGMSVYLGGGTVQGPGILAKIGRDMAEGAFTKLSPSELVTKAVGDGAWERMLRTRLPQPETWWRDGRLLLKHARRVVAVQDALMLQAQRQLEKEGE